MTNRLLFMAGLLLASNLCADEAGLQAQLDALKAEVQALKAVQPGEAAASGLKASAQITAFYKNAVAAGDDAAGVSRNRGAASSIVDLGFEGEPTKGVEAAAVFRLNASGQAEAWDLWLQAGSEESFSLRGGFLDLTGVFDDSRYANDEKSQFVRAEFVDSPVLGQGPNAPALMARLALPWDLGLRAAAQNRLASGTDPFDQVFLIAQLEAAWGGEQGGQARVWARENDRGSTGAVPAVGLVLDQAFGSSLGAFLRAAREFKATGREDDGQGNWQAAPLNAGGVSGTEAFTELQAGLQVTGLLPFRPEDRVNAAWGRTAACDGSAWDYAEAGYTAVFGEGFLASLHYQADFSRLTEPVPHDWDGDAVTDHTTYVASDPAHALVGRVSAFY